jgi:hypothetical protein
MRRDLEAMRHAALAVIAGVGCLAGAGLLLASPAPAQESKASETPVADRAALVGHWKLNAELSEDPREKLRQAMERGGGGGYPRGPGGGGMGHPGGGGAWGGMGRHGGGGGGGGGGGDTARPTGMAFLTATELTVTNVEPEVSIVEPEGVVRNLHPDGKKYETSSGGEVKTRWDGDRLQVETKSERGQVKEIWSVSPETRRLTVELQIQRGGMAPVGVKRVFDPAKTDVDAP